MSNPVPAPAATAQWESLLRSALKIGGSVLTTLGVVDASQGAAIGGPVLDSLLALIGSAATLYGLFKSYWHHAP
jgi:hypothetical protein